MAPAAATTTAAAPNPARPAPPAAGGVVPEAAPGRALVVVADPEVAGAEPVEVVAVVEAPAPAVRGPEQSQWSPWGWQPVEAVGEGGRTPELWSWSSSSWSVLVLVAADDGWVAVPAPVAVVRGPSQSQ